MMGSNYPDDRRLPPNEGQDLMMALEWILSGANLTTGNLEGVLLDSGGTAKTCRNPDACYVFRSPTSYARNLACAGFDVVSMANNHAGDFGTTGTYSTMEALAALQIGCAGTQGRPFALIDRDSVRYGYIAFAPNTGCQSLHDLPEARMLVGFLDSLCDVVIVSFHGGAEGKPYQHVPRKHEMFYGEDRGDVYAFAHAVIDAGADIVFGSGPHVPRAIEVYKNRFIAYSLGNFCTYGGMNLTGVNGLAPILKVYVTAMGVFLRAQIISAYQVPAAGVYLDPGQRVVSVMGDLTKEDFPENPVRIGENGLITYLKAW